MTRTVKPGGPFRLRRVRALLAAGLVLGVGAGATLAAWDDSEFTAAHFSSATFGIEGAVDGQPLGDHPADDPAVLPFTAADGMLPGQTSYAGYVLQTIAGSVPADVSVIPGDANTQGLGQYLRYGMALTPGTTCDEASFGAGQEIVPAGSALDTSSATPFRMDSTANVCVSVTLPAGTPSAAQGLPSAVSWEFRATAMAG